MVKLDKNPVLKAAGLLMLVQVLSRLLGYARDVILQNVYGQGNISDAYTIAFRIPDFIYNVLIGGGISAAFIPVFAAYIAQKREEQAWRTSSIFSTWVMLLMLISLSFAMVFARPLVDLLTSGYTGSMLDLPTALTRITLLQALLMALSAIATGILQSFQHFTWPAIGTLLYNVCIILGGLLLIEPIEAMWPGYGVAGFSVGVVVGAFLTLAVQIPTLRKVGFNYSPSLDTRDPGLRQMVKLLIPVLIGLSVSQINLFVTQYLATGLAEGTLTALTTANRFFQLPLGVFAVSICTAIFPTMTAQAAEGQLGEMKASLSMALRNISFVLLPATLGLIMLREPIIRLLFEFSGKFTPAMTAVTSDALLYYCLGLIAYGVAAALCRAFYAIQNTLIPVLVSMLAILVNIVFSFALVGPLSHRGLALAYSLAGFAQAGFLLIFLRRKIGQMDLRHIVVSLGKTLAATAVMALLVWLTAQACAALIGVGSKLGQLIQVGAAVAVGVAAFFVAASVLKMEELNAITSLIGKKLHKRKSAS